MEDLIHDLRYAFRVILKSPVLSGLAILSLALGIGANTTIFSVANALLLQSVPAADPARLVAIYTTDQKNPGFAPLSHLNWKDYRAQADLFEGVLGYDWTEMSLKTTGEAQRVFGQLVSGNYFEVLGVPAALGRTFGPREDEALGRDPVVVLSHGFWTRHEGSDRNIVGKTLALNGAAFTVVGVMPEAFTGVDVGVRPEVWVPMAMNRQVKGATNWYEERRGLFVNTVGRLKPGVAKEQAQAQLTTIAQRLEQEYPNDNKGRGVTVVPIAQATINPQARQGVVAVTALLMTIVGLVLLIACANVSNLLLGRALQRRREIAVRLAIGASRARLVRQLLTESIALALPAAALGVLIAFWARGTLLSLLPAFPVSLSLHLDLDWRVLTFTMAVGVASGVLFGLLPALQASKPDVVNALKDQDRTGGVVHHRFGIRDFLVVGQVALSLVALVGAGLFLRSLEATSKTDPGFEPTKLITVGIDLDLQGYNQEKGEAFLRQLDERLSSLPGVASFSYASSGPLSGFGLSRSVFLEGGNEGDRTLVSVNPIGPRYFETMGIPLVAGRPITEEDKEGGTKVVVINETMAKKFWPAGDALGKRFRFFGEKEPWAVIVGIAKDSKYAALGEDPQSYIYEAHAQRYGGGRTLIVRTSTEPGPLVRTVEGEIKAFDHELPLVGVETVGQTLANSLWAARAGASLLGLFGFLALVLAAVGIYSVMSYSVSQRQREIGIRMALGARRTDVLRMIMTRGMSVVGIGLGLGLVLSFGLSRLASNMLVGVSPWDAVSFLGAAAVLSVVAVLANFFPTRRAAGVDPTVALRYQ